MFGLVLKVAKGDPVIDGGNPSLIYKSAWKVTFVNCATILLFDIVKIISCPTGTAFEYLGFCVIVVAI